MDGNLVPGPPVSRTARARLALLRDFLGLLFWRFRRRLFQGRDLILEYGNDLFVDVALEADNDARQLRKGQPLPCRELRMVFVDVEIGSGYSNTSAPAI